MTYLKPFSYDDFLTYKIQEGDTPKIVSEKLNVDLYELRSYHNFRAPVEDGIKDFFPSHLEFLIIKPAEAILTDEEKEKNRQKVLFNDGFGRLSLNHSHGEKIYTVLSTIENGTAVHTLKEEFKVSWRAEQNNHHFYYITRIGEVYVNDIEPETMAANIAAKASQAMYPLLTVVDEDGRWVYINNIKDIRKRWEKTKKQLQKYYKGISVEKYFKIYDKSLENSDALFLSLSKNWFLNVFFNGIHVHYPPSLCIEKEIEFPFIAKSENLKYKAEVKLDDYLDTDNLIAINIEGKLSDKRTKSDFANELGCSAVEYSEEKPEGNYKAKYFLNPNSYMPEAFSVSCTLELDISQKYSINASSLNTKKDFVIATREPIFVERVVSSRKDYTLFWMFTAVIVLLAVVISFFMYINKLTVR